MALASTRPLTEMSTRSITCGPVSWNLGTLTSWNPQCHSRPVTGLLNPPPFFLLVIWNGLCLMLCRSHTTSIHTRGFHVLDVEGSSVLETVTSELHVCYVAVFAFRKKAGRHMKMRKVYEGYNKWGCRTRKYFPLILNDSCQCTGHLDMISQATKMHVKLPPHVAETCRRCTVCII